MKEIFRIEYTTFNLNTGGEEMKEIFRIEDTTFGYYFWFIIGRINYYNYCNYHKNITR